MEHYNIQDLCKMQGISEDEIFNKTKNILEEFNGLSHELILSLIFSIIRLICWENNEKYKWMLNNFKFNIDEELDNKKQIQ